MSSKGRNPFDRTTNLPKDAPPSKAGGKALKGKPSNAVEWERIRAAGNVAGQQKARTEKALAAPIVVPPKVVARPVKPVIVPVCSPPATVNWTAGNIWTVCCYLLWVVLTLAAMSGSFLGGLILSIPLFFLANLLAQSPGWVGSASLDGGRNKQGKAV